MFFEELHIWRTIWTDGRPLPKDPDPSWLGYSVGRWEGDTFRYRNGWFSNDKVWADLSGNPRSEQMHLTERYRRLNHDYSGAANHHRRSQVVHKGSGSVLRNSTNSKPHLGKIAEWFCATSEVQDLRRTKFENPLGVAPGPDK